MTAPISATDVLDVERIKKDFPILDHLEPDRVHILIDGRIVDSGGPELAHRLEEGGFESWR